MFTKERPKTSSISAPKNVKQFAYQQQIKKKTHRRGLCPTFERQKFHPN
jgi:hypothetical protein